jgi:CRISPR-associated protein Csm5
MRQESHLQVFELTLTARSPVFIGCGKSYTKKEYIFDPRNNMVSFLDERLMFDYLAEHNLADAYEGYILGHMGRNLRDFLLNICEIPQRQIDQWIRCRVYAGGSLDDNHTLKEIQRFVRNARGQVFIPGSSIKGALRTVLLKQILLKSPPQDPDPQLPFARYGSFEDDYFHTLSLKKDRNQMVIPSSPLNSILRGFQVSDSLPIPDSDMCLTQKIDAFVHKPSNAVNICRECIRPGTVIRCVVTLDQSVLQGAITKESILGAIAEASEHYQKNVLARYPHVSNDMNARTILLGGGAGFQSKTVTDIYYGEKSLAVTSSVLQKTFFKHHHERDITLGISPRALKQTDINGIPYSYGICEVTLE